MQVAGRALKGSQQQHRRQPSDTSGSLHGNGDAEHDAVGERIRFGDEPEDGGRKGSGGGGGRLRLDIEQPKPEWRSNGHYTNLSGASWRSKVACPCRMQQGVTATMLFFDSPQTAAALSLVSLIWTPGTRLYHWPLPAGSDVGSELDGEEQSEPSAGTHRPQVSFLTAVLMAVALTFHSLLEVRLCQNWAASLGSYSSSLLPSHVDANSKSLAHSVPNERGLQCTEALCLAPHL